MKTISEKAERVRAADECMEDLAGVNDGVMTSADALQIIMEENLTVKWICLFR